MRAQTSLEYLILIVLTLSIAAVTVMFVSGSFGSQRDPAAVAFCKEAAAQCKALKALNPLANCSSCIPQCSDDMGFDVIDKTTQNREGGPYGIGVTCCRLGFPDQVYAGRTTQCSLPPGNLTTNNPPTLSVFATMASCVSASPCTFRAITGDPDGDAVSLSWRSCTLTFTDGRGYIVSQACGANSTSAAGFFTTTPSQSGELGVIAAATDSRGASTTGSANVSVSPPQTANQPPALTLNAPVSCTVGSACSFTASASDTDGTISEINWVSCNIVSNNVRYGCDSPTISNAGISTSSATSTFTTTPSRTGELSIIVSTIDNDGSSVTKSAVMDITAGSANNPPSLTITPFTSWCTAGYSCRFSATATDPDGISWPIAWLCSFTIAGGSAQTCSGTTNSDGTTFATAIPSGSSGTLIINASVSDARGAFATRGVAQSVFGTTSNPPPSVSLTAPSSCRINTDCVFTASFSDPGGTFQGIKAAEWMCVYTQTGSSCSGTQSADGTRYTVRVTGSAGRNLLVYVTVTDVMGASTTQSAQTPVVT